jgi:arabinan endo-1,5-alpha-L-arabinosidase
VLRSASGLPEGPYQVVTPGLGQVTPRGQFCLDGHLYFGEPEPFLVFCREHVEVGVGRVCAMQLSAKLDRPAGEAFDLFRATDAPWVRAVAPNHFVTDGCFCWRSRATKELLLLWSSIGEGGNYMVGVARSQSGQLKGPWTHDVLPLYEADGGHCMLFRPLPTDVCPPWFDGDSALPLIMALHAPNKDVL